MEKKLSALRSLATSVNRSQKGNKSSRILKYNVLLSCGPTRTVFTDLLYSGLASAGYRVFRDYALPVGKQEIDPEDLQVIRNCRVLIPVISQAYTKTEGCLQELAEIMYCSRKRRKLLLPIFYGVHHLRLRDEIPEECEKMMHCRPQEVVQKWVRALRCVSWIHGHYSEPGYGESAQVQLVKMVVERVSREIPTALSCFSVYVTMPFAGHRYLLEMDTSRVNCQVFLAFGIDTELNIAAFLNIALTVAEINVLTVGDLALLGDDAEVREFFGSAIRNSKIAIPILSKDFSASRRCLEHLAQMMENKRTKGQKILPIFYEVEPSHVRDISHVFGEHMRRHKAQVDQSIYERWERALTEVCSCESGRIGYGHDVALVKAVTDEVKMLLKMH